MEFLNEIGAWLAANRELFFKVTRVISVLALVLGSAVTIGLIVFFPIRIRFGIIRLEGLLKLICTVLVIGWMVFSAGVLISSTFVVIAKYIILNVMIGTSVTAWILLLTWPQINAALIQIQQECEVATNLTFLQAEMARAQLESLNDRIQRATQPEQREVTETMLKTISPLVTMFLKRERSVIKWSVAAVDVGKSLMGYFFSDKK
jgi:hypothetical protein